MSDPAPQPALVQVCTEFAQTGECIAYAWMEYAPPMGQWLDMESAAGIGGAIGLVWATAYVIRLVRLQLESSINDRV